MIQICHSKKAWNFYILENDRTG
ncbi:hypothetical protein V6N11_061030 [Hibiscus sabdariffa]|uniref:Uncharacterized protein n=1 Tax=Hibiscus sabdariffa TaxID=183260 RepID=A0ABR2QS16_9ROSI